MQEQPKEKKYRKRKGFEDDGGHHELPHDESNWLVSYADMMTLLFGFFVLMYSFSKLDKQKFNSVRENLTTYFGGEMKEDLQAMAMKNEIKQMMAESDVDANQFEVSGGDGRIVLKFSSDLLFASGSADISSAFRPLLARAIKTVSSRKNIKGVEVEGHTDVVPINSMIYPSNWELSTARASRVVREVLKLGVSEKKMSAKGFGSARPVKPSYDKKGRLLKENLRKNRRVVINVDFGRDISGASELLDKKEFVKPKKKSKKAGKKTAKKAAQSQRRPSSATGKKGVSNQKRKGKKAESDMDLLKDRLLKAQKQFEEANKKARERQKEEAARQKMLEKIKQFEEQTKQLNGNED